MKFKYKFLFALLFALLSMQVIFTMIHEQAHSETAKTFGCVDVYITYDFIGGLTHSTCTLNEGTLNAMRLAQSNIEAVGYHMQIIMYVMFMLTLIIGLTIMRDE